MQPDLTLSTNDNFTTAKARLISMYDNIKVHNRPVGEQRAYLTILRWLSEEAYKPIVKLELIKDELTLSYVRAELKKLEPQLTSIERSFKHLKPYSMYVSQMTHGYETWKQWKFKRTVDFSVRSSKKSPSKPKNLSPRDKNSKQKNDARKRLRAVDDNFNLSLWQRKQLSIPEELFVPEDGTDGSSSDIEDDEKVPKYVSRRMRKKAILLAKKQEQQQFEEEESPCKKPSPPQNLSDYDVSQIVFDFPDGLTLLGMDFDWDNPIVEMSCL